MEETYFRRAIRDTESKVDNKHNDIRYITKDVKRLVSRLKEMKKAKPDMTKQDIMKNIEQRINKNIEVISRTKMTLPVYMDYSCTRFLLEDDKRYEEISEIVQNSGKNYKKLSHSDCCTMDEHLESALYTSHESAFFLSLINVCEETEENIKRFPTLFKKLKKEKEEELISKNKYTDKAKLLLSDSLKEEEKKAILKKVLSEIKDPKEKKDFIQTLEFYEDPVKKVLSGFIKSNNKELGNELAKCVHDMYEELKSLEKISDYMVSFISQMCESDFTEYITCFIDKTKIKDIKKFGEEIKQYDKDASFYKNKRISEVLNLKQLDNIMSRETLETLNIEQLFALSSFWSNRLSKELDSYSKTIFVAENIGILDQIANNEEPTDIREISEEDLKAILMKMGIFYNSSYKFLRSKKNDSVTIESPNTMSDAKESLDEDNVKDLEGLYENVIKINSDISKTSKKYGEEISSKIDSEEYTEYFSRRLPGVKNDLKSDAELAAMLYAPIFYCYDIKDNIIECALMGMEYDPKEYYNAGVILDKDDDINERSRKKKIIIGMDVGLSFPVRLHVYKEDLIKNLYGNNANSIIREYMGADDFNERQKNTYIVMPLVGQMKRDLDKKIKEVEKNPKKYEENGKFITHLGFSKEKTPSHLITRYKNDRGRKKTEFIPKYIDIETGEEFTIQNDGNVERYDYADMDKRLEKNESER